MSFYPTWKQLTYIGIYGGQTMLAIFLDEFGLRWLERPMGEP